jgi:predicted SnoaL-like aldol condensation-catalyzing enzyme
MKFFLFMITIVLLQQTTWAGLPVIPAEDQQRLLLSADANLTTKKRLVYDFTRIVLSGRRLEQAAAFLKEDYIQHNPNVETGLKGFLDFFSKLGGPRPVPETVKGLVSIHAEGDLVTMAFVNQQTDASGAVYTTTWFDMFRIEDGKIAEHWDCDTK